MRTMLMLGLAMLAAGGCQIDLIDDAISNELRTSFIDTDLVEVQADTFISQDKVFAAADKACGVPASPLSREERPGDPGYYFMTFRCERPAPFPPLRDNHPLPPVLRQPNG